MDTRLKRRFSLLFFAAHADKLGSTNFRTNKLVAKTGRFAQRVREHVRLGPRISETPKGKLSLGAKILWLGGVRKVFNQKFNSREGEKLLKASQCYLSTTEGPVAGLLFVSTEKVAFCSERLIKVSSPTGEVHRVQYKVVIPLGKIERVNDSENMKQPSRKYIQIITRDDFEFGFMGFLNHRRTIIYIYRMLSLAHNKFNSDENSTKRVLPADAVRTMFSYIVSSI